MTPPRSLLANAVYAIGGTGFYHTCQLGVLVLLNKFATPEITGQYFLALAIATPVLQFFGFELRGALVADAGNQFSVGAYLALRRTMLQPAAVLLAAVAIWQATAHPYLPHVAILVGVFGGRLLWAVAEVGWGTYQRRERLDLVAWSYALRGVGLLAPFALLLPLAYAQHGDRVQTSFAAAGAVLLHALGYAAVWFLYDRRRIFDTRLWDLTWTWRALRALAWQTFPLGVVALAINLCDSLPRWLFESPRVPNGSAQLGYFGSLAYITLAGNLVIIQATTAAANRLALHYQRDLPAFLRLAGRLTLAAMGIGGVVMVIALFFGRWILTALYTPEYAQFETAFRIIVLAHCLALMTNIFGAATTQMRLFWAQVPIQLITLVGTGAAAVLLIPGPRPVYGAALTALVRASLQLMLYGGCVLAGVLLRDRALRR